MDKSSHLEDGVLISLLKKNDINAYEMLFHKYFPILYAFNTQFIVKEDAQEIAQEIMLWLWEKRETITIDTSLKNYLLRIAYNRTLNLIKKRHIKQRIEEYFIEQFYRELQTTDFSDLEKQSQIIIEAIKQLPQKHQEVFIKHRFEKKTYKQIALELDISPKTVEYRIRQSIKFLQTTLKGKVHPMLITLLIKQIFNQIVC